MSGVLFVAVLAVPAAGALVVALFPAHLDRAARLVATACAAVTFVLTVILGATRNAGWFSYQAGVPSIPALAQWAAATYAEAEAVVDGDTRLSFRELADLAHRATRATIAAGVKRVGFIGTTVAMSDSFFVDRMAGHGLELVVPPASEHEWLNSAIYEELVHGMVLPRARNRVVGRPEPAEHRRPQRHRAPARAADPAARRVRRGQRDPAALPL